MQKEPRQTGLDVRRAMFGPEYAGRALERATDFTRRREQLPRKVRLEPAVQP